MRTMELRILILGQLCFLAFGANCLDSLNMRLLRHAENVPASSSITVQDLTNYLVKSTSNDYEKVEVMFYWIANNIEYDFEAYTEDVYFESYQETFNRKRGICQNYAALLKKMCEFVNIPCFTISGYAKGYGFEKGEYFAKTNHAWNVVEVYGEYYYLDPTWGSGKFREEDYGFEYQKQIDLSQVLVRGDGFLSEHLPADPRWQLRESIIDMEDFIWNSSFDELAAKSGEIYHYQDSITFYRSLSELDRTIFSLESSNRFFQTEVGIKILGDYCYQKAYEISTREASRSELRKALELYSRAIELYEEIEISDPGIKEWIGRAKDGIIYVEYKMSRRR